MKRPFFQQGLTILAFAVSSILCAPASAQDMKEDAFNFLAKKWGIQKSECKSAVAHIGQQTESVQYSTDTLGNVTFMNIEQNDKRGFVVFAKNNRIVGYSTTQTANIKDIPYAMREMLGSFTAPDTVNSYPVSIAPVQPFIRTQWGQHAPFNAACPTYKGQPSVAGCTAVALAQVLNYYRSNKTNNYLYEYVDSRSGAEISVDYGKTSYDWSNIIDDYSDTTKYTQAQADAVAKLVYEAGVACNAQYSSTSTTGYWPAIALSRFYDYNADFLMRKKLPTDYWMKRLYAELAAGRPVLYSGTGSNGGNRGAHEFIIDGNDADGLVHINWGWHGDCDGYYDISYCRPNDSEGRDHGYTYDHLMICGIRPRTTADNPYKEGYVCTTGSTFYTDNWRYVGNVDGITTNTYGAPADTLEWDVVQISTKTGQMLFQPSRTSVDSYAYDVRILRPGYGNSDFTMEAGRYDWRLAYRTKGETDWTIAELPMRPWVEYDAKGQVTNRGWYDYDGPATDDFTIPFIYIDDVKPMTEVVSGAPFFLWIKSHSTRDADGQGVQYGGTSYTFLTFTNVETGKEYKSNKSSTVYDVYYNNLAWSGVSFVEKPTYADNGFSMPGGRYKLGADDTDVAFPNDLYIDVKDKVDYPLLCYSYNSYEGDNTFSTIDIKRPDGYTHSYTQDNQITVLVNSLFDTANNVYGTSTMNFYLCPQSDPTLQNEILFATYKAEYPSSTVQYVTLPGNLYPLEGRYYAYVRYMANDGEHEIMPYRWDNGYGVDEKTGLYAHPCEIYIGKSADGTFPKIEITNVTSTTSGISFTAKNIGADDFNGKIYVNVYNKEKGEYDETSTDILSLAAGNSRNTTVNHTMSAEANYDIYFRCLRQTEARTASTTTQTFATKPDGEIAYFHISNLSGIESVTAQKPTKIHTDGRKIESSNGNTFSVFTSTGNCLCSDVTSYIVNVPGVYIIKSHEGIYKLATR